MNKTFINGMLALSVVLSITALSGCAFFGGNSSEHEHTLVAVEAKDATCTVAGNRAYYACEGCDKVFFDVEATSETTVEEQTLPAIGHIFDDAAWGYKGADGHAHTCACGAKDSVEAHVSDGEATEEKAERCVDCGYEIAPMVGHTHEALEDDADCTTDVKCSCGHLMQEGEAEHLYDNACDSDCNRDGCQGTRTVGAHVDKDSDEECDECGEAMPKKGGEIELPEDHF
jgi:hypothetical protein